MYIAVRIYGNGAYMNCVYPTVYKYYSAVEKQCSKLNEKSDRICNENKWIPMALHEHDTADWD